MSLRQVTYTMLLLVQGLLPDVNYPDGLSTHRTASRMVLAFFRDRASTMRLRLLAAAAALGLAACTLTLVAVTDDAADDVMVVAPASFQDVPLATSGPRAT
jgi:hypothetical protein